jgi:hypothetical protein
MDFKIGFIFLLIAMITVPVTINSLNKWDQSEEDFKRGCDPTYRIYMGIQTDVSADECDMLEDEKTLNLQIFLISLSMCITSSLVGLISIFPNSDETPHGLI